MAPSASADAFLEAVKGRRTIYQLTNESTIPDSRIEEILREIILHTPSSFNCQTARVVLLLKEDHQKFWDIAFEEAQKAFPPEVFEKFFRERVGWYRAGYGTALFYEDQAKLKELENKMPMFKDKFSQWSEHSGGMHQYAAWAAFAAEGLGANLQHYDFMKDPATKGWNVPEEWDLKSQLVFGKPTGPPREKTTEPIEKRLFVHGK